eukprot:gnl/TRDRNA2_/TRDRNA2_156878_c0_seq6.p1 gnl/TRDRNA2_/TRDRNA2_156878_c0~~gnl/TRDRNA2_/TRDRNA2_156878_c0_seq6.p1  ORF type:complete len:147 (+),score=18.25 gnl/TRDRNA2_/TRDRNA2_156878_c0_seq6:68-508(+)
MSTEKLPRTPGDRRWENQKSSFENILNDLKTPVQVWWELAEPEAPPPEGITDFGWWCFKVMQQEQDEIVLEPGEDTGYFPLLMDLLHLICGRHLTAKPDDKPTCKEYRAPNEAQPRHRQCLSLLCVHHIRMAVGVAVACVHHIRNY